MNNTSVKNRILQFQTQSRGDISSNSANNNKSHKNRSCVPIVDSLSPTKSTSSSISSFISSVDPHSNANYDSPVHSKQSNGLQFNSISSNSFLANSNTNVNKTRTSCATMNTNNGKNFPPNGPQSFLATMQAKKASMTINLANNDGGAGNDQGSTSNTNPPTAKSRTPTKNPSFSSIPKLTTSGGTGNSNMRNPNSLNRSNENSLHNTPPQNFKVQRTHTSPNIIRNANSNLSIGNSTVKKVFLSPTNASPMSPSNVGFGSSTGRFYGSIGWKEKYEESEKKRLHVVTLAQKATRDYEELRRRYQDLHTEHEKLLHKFEGAANQLDSLRQASEAAYDEYYKLKKKYEVENTAKSEALNRVDQYNRENRRLKRASALMMQHISDPTSFTDGIIHEVSEADNPDNDKEIEYLRNRVQELESRIVDLESELEKIKLAEFETQESVMIMNDAVQSSKNESSRLKEQFRKLDEENRRLQSTLDDTLVELESLKDKCNVDDEKLVVAETELKKLMNEKNILQRQSMVFLSDEMDNRLLDALNQIGDLQTALEEQKNSSEAQIAELRNQLQEKEYHEETTTMQTNEKIKSLQEEIAKLLKRAELAEKKLDEMPFETPGLLPPPPPPLPNFAAGTPSPLIPPPPPMPSKTPLNSSLNSTMRTLKRVNLSGSNSDATSTSSTPPNGLEGQPKSLMIDDVISQLKQGQIKLRPMDKTLSRKPLEIKEKQPESTAVDDLRSILNNLKRTQRLHN